MSDEKKAYFSPLCLRCRWATKSVSPSIISSSARKREKRLYSTVPACFAPLFSMAASMADVDIARLPPCGNHRIFGKGHCKMLRPIIRQLPCRWRLISI